MTTEFRSAEHGVEIRNVSFPQRLVELIVMPYETEAMIFEGGKTFTEIVSRTAFQGIEARNDRIRVNRDHDVRRSCGRAVRFYSSREEGLVADIHISKTELGNETLALADDGVLDASAGFRLLTKDGRVVPDAEVWETRDRRRLNHLYLSHIALTPEPAYDSAQVLAVRQTASCEPTAASVRMPNRERLELETFQALYASIDSRYS